MRRCRGRKTRYIGGKRRSDVTGFGRPYGQWGRHRVPGPSTDTHPTREPAHQPFYRPWARPSRVRALGYRPPVTWLTSSFTVMGTRHCLVSGLFVPREQHPDDGHRARRGDMGAELGF